MAKTFGRAKAPAPVARKTAPILGRPAAGPRAKAPAAPAARPAAPAAPAPRAAAVASAPAKPQASTRVRVRAIKMGLFANERRRVGDVFLVPRQNYNPSWMQAVDGSVPIQRTTGKQELRRLHDELLQQKRADTLHTNEHDLPTGSANPLGADE